MFKYSLIVIISLLFSQNTSVEKQLSSKLDQSLQSFSETGQLSGSVALIAIDGKIQYHRAIGMQSIEDNQEMKLNTLFRIASMTKPITAVAIMILVEEGYLTVNDNASKFIPELANLRIQTEDGQFHKLNKPITIKHLLMHTSGMHNRGDQIYNDVDFSQAKTLQQYIALLLQKPLKHQPGEEFTYAMNSDVLSRIVEIITGEKFGDFLQERIFKVLKMNDTYFQVPDSELQRVASVYKTVNGHLELTEGKVNSDVDFPRGNSGLISTVEDYFKFAQMLLNKGELNGVRLLKVSTVEELTSNHLPAELVPLKIGNTVLPDTGFGYSVAVSLAASYQIKELKFSNFANLPKHSFTWPGIVNTYWWVDPVNKVTGILFTQSANVGQINNFQDFTQTFYKEFNVYNAFN